MIFKNPLHYIKNVLETISKNDMSDIILYYPDAGSAKRYSEILSQYRYCYGEKKRDWKTGKILGLEIKTNGIDLNEKTILMIDDIVSYGGSLYYSANTLKEYGVDKIYAYATHTENSILDKEKGTLIKALENNTVEKNYLQQTVCLLEHMKKLKLWRYKYKRHKRFNRKILWKLVGKRVVEREIKGWKTFMDM